MDERSDGNIRRQSSCRSSGIGSWWSSSNRHTTTGLAHFGRREFDDGADASYHQMDAGEARQPDRRRRSRGGWVGAWKRLLTKRWRLFEPTKVSARDCPGYDPGTYAQNFDAGDSFRLEPENLSRSFSAQFANPSGFLQRRI